MTWEDPLTEGLQMLTQSSAQPLAVEIWIKQTQSHFEPLSEDCPCAYAQLHLTESAFAGIRFPLSTHTMDWMVFSMGPKATSV